ncbi:hypothetical protein AMAG_17558 [Allomyces macrogynus ATCC 38327]|uniref:Uncharacterized protein n=1 Tax=Allomyces macrogynus (strain ATCC 38327) TaxID=578462 RepID=A0A0L0TFF2_ALLM3|nr:hypothetical protein AMAG_17558 [Allomyces macrogynus ATCC 38327]|eukprot:KNE73334.1 hypothetical protein AMAG_17558 [Allomyces macrogynus ATCC 38327]
MARPPAPPPARDLGGFGPNRPDHDGHDRHATSSTLPQEQYPSPDDVMEIHNNELLHTVLACPPLEAIDDLINAVNQTLVHDLLDDLQQNLPTWTDGHVPDLDDQAAFQLESRFSAALDKDWTRFEIYAMQAVFAVPPNLYLPLPHEQDLSPPQPGEEAALDHDMHQLRHRLYALRTLQDRLSVASAHMADQIQALESVEAALATLESAPAIDLAQPAADLTTTTHAVLAGPVPAPTGVPSKTVAWVRQEVARVVQPVETDDNHGAVGHAARSDDALPPALLDEYAHDLAVSAVLDDAGELLVDRSGARRDAA